jgi:putative ABC transport system substrate-binding protein
VILSYGPDGKDLARQAAGYVVRILRGVKPWNLSVEQSTKIEIVVNLKTARILGLTIPSAVLARADEIIQ